MRSTTCGKTDNGIPCPLFPGHGGTCLRIPTVAEAIDLEAEYLSPGKHELAVRERFGMTPTRYQQFLTSYLTTDEAVAHNPILVHSIRARRDVEAKARADRTFLSKHRKA
jgi:hypothetical protein